MARTDGRPRGGTYGDGMCAADAIGRVSDDLGRVRDAVMRRCHGEPVTVHETHISWVLVAGDRAFKLKKPVVLD
ncbi:MAG: hypothetical protein ACJ780_00130, partial [Solirubrobacteraceae bacterium]